MTQPTLADLLAAIAGTRSDETLVLLHAAESRGQRPISPPELSRLFDEARHKRPNVHRELERLRAEGHALRVKDRYELSHAGFRQAEELLVAAGLLSSSPAADTVKRLRDVSHRLRSHSAAIPNAELRAFAEEALSCLDPGVGALRAAVVMAWAGGVARLKERIWARGSSIVAAQVAQLKWKQVVRKEDDLDDLKESQLLILGHELGLYDKAALKSLTHDLDLRNASAHPTDVPPGLHKVEAFLDDVLPLMYV